MEQEVFNRYEKKYLISQKEFGQLIPVFNEYMVLDPHNIQGNPYSICNLYLDNQNDELIRNSIEKPAYKEKLRLRSYGIVKPQDTVYLEIKKKYEGLVNKRRTPLALADAMEYLDSGKKIQAGNLNKQVMNEIEYIQKLYKTVPKVFISYDRIAFFSKEKFNKNDDFRLTLDTNIKTRRTDLRLDSQIYGESILPEDTWILEAKSFYSFPLWFSKLLSQKQIFPESFSKYGTEFIQNVLGKNDIVG